MQNAPPRRGRPPKRSLTAAAVDIKEEICTRDQDVSAAPDKTTVTEEQGDIGPTSSSQVDSSVTEVHVESSVDCTDAVDISNAFAINSLENGTLYLLQPLDSAVDAQNGGCRTLRVIGRTNGDEDGGNTLFVAASSADLISNQADLVQFLQSAGITGIKAESASQAQSSAQ